MSKVQPQPRLRETPVTAIAEALQEAGLWLDVGSATVRVQGDSPPLATQLRAAYAEFPFAAGGAWADVHCRLDVSRGLRRWLRPQVVFRSDGREIFSPFPADSPLPLFEWGCNWLIGQRLNHHLLLHAGVVEKQGRALVLPATPGSGKSTLTAALTQRGWRLLSDEFGVLDLDAGLFRPMLKPVALKNASIDVIQRFAPAAAFGPRFPKTRKGTVSHMAPSAHAVDARRRGAAPGLVILPRWQAGHPTRWEPIEPDVTFAALAFNAFNYQLIGEAAFDAVVTLARTCPAWRLTYSDLDEVVQTLEDRWAAHPFVGPAA